MLFLIVLLNASSPAWARIGVDNSGGGMPMTMVTLNCEGGAQLQFREYSVDEDKRGAGRFIWVTSRGSQTQEIQTSLSYGASGGRIISYSDFYCSRDLMEIDQWNWRLESSCEGQNFTTDCARQP